MPTKPNLLDRLLLYRLNQGPAPMVDLFGAAAFESVTLAMELGLFEAMGEDPKTPEDLATTLDADPEGLQSLLRFLASQGYVEGRGNAYRPTAMTRKWLLADSATNMGPWLTFWDDLVFPYWDEHFETTIRGGEPPETLYEWLGDDEDAWRMAQAGFRAVARILVDEVAGKVDVPDGPARLLDVGGGHGLYAAELCTRHPALEATVFDHPVALDAARETIAEHGLEARMDVEGGDYLADDLGEGYDVALLFNVIHAHDGDGNTRLFERVFDALAPGGSVVVLDQLEGSSRFSAVGQAGLGFVGLTYHVTLGATIHPYVDVVTWLEAAGFEDVGKTAIRRASPGNVLVSATKGA